MAMAEIFRLLFLFSFEAGAGVIYFVAPSALHCGLPLACRTPRQYSMLRMFCPSYQGSLSNERGGVQLLQAKKVLHQAHCDSFFCIDALPINTMISL